MGEDCNMAISFTPFFDPYYFNCFTFQPQMKQKQQTSLLHGEEYGLTMLMFMASAGQINKGDLDGVIVPGMEETEATMARGRAAKVLVHPPHTAAYPSSGSVDVPAGSSVTLGVRSQENFRISNPWGKCTERDHNSTYQYTLRECQIQCVQKKIMDTCGCIDNKVSIPQDERTLPFCLQLPEDICPTTMSMGGVEYDDGRSADECALIRSKWSDRVICRNQVVKNLSLGLDDDFHCNCNAPCHESVYDASYSSSRLPENTAGQVSFFQVIETFLDDLPEQKKDILDKKYGETYKTDASEFVSRITVYIADNNVITTTESAGYEAIHLLADVGGLLALWLGVSVMTVFELVQLVADVCRMIADRRSRFGNTNP